MEVVGLDGGCTQEKSILYDRETSFRYLFQLGREEFFCICIIHNINVAEKYCLKFKFYTIIRIRTCVAIEMVL